jgi:prepilin-type processing-associated H-X9-DG protein
MIGTQFDVQSLEGRRVNVALADGSVMGPVPLVLARRNTLWVVADGEDTFVPLDRVVDVWDAPVLGRSRGVASRARLLT